MLQNENVTSAKPSLPETQVSCAACLVSGARCVFREHLPHARQLIHTSLRSVVTSQHQLERVKFGSVSGSNNSQSNRLCNNAYNVHVSPTTTRRSTPSRRSIFGEKKSLLRNARRRPGSGHAERRDPSSAPRPRKKHV